MMWKCWLMCGCWVLAGPLATGQISRPNLIIIVADQLRRESCGYAGNTRAITPHIDRLAEDGISFDNYVVNTPVSAATQATLWTGKYASSHGMMMPGLRISPQQDTLAHLLNGKGYTCDYIGQWPLWSRGERHEQTDDAVCPPGPDRLGFDGFWATSGGNRPADDSNDRANALGGGQKMGHATLTRLTNLAIERVHHHAAAGRSAESAQSAPSARLVPSAPPPFALVVSYSPYDPEHKQGLPARWSKRFANTTFSLPATWSDVPDPHMENHTDPQRWQSHWKVRMPELLRADYAMTAALDEQVGRLLQALQDSDLADNTIVVLTANRGAQFGANARVGGLTFFDKTARVPLLIRWPGRIPRGRRSNACVAAVDLMPTLCGMLGVGYPDAVDGIDLSDSTRVDCSCEPDFAFLQGMGHSSLWQDGFEWRAIRDQRFTYARYRVNEEELLFDNVADPEQSTNLAADPHYREDLKKRRQWLTEKMLAMHDEFSPCTWYRDNWIVDRQIQRGANGPFVREFVELPATLPP